MLFPMGGGMVQWVEWPSCNWRVAGSIPACRAHVEQDTEPLTAPGGSWLAPCMAALPPSVCDWVNVMYNVKRFGYWVTGTVKRYINTDHLPYLQL